MPYDLGRLHSVHIDVGARTVTVGASCGARRHVCLGPVACLLLLPLIVAVLTAVFLGYAAWLLACRLCQLTSHTIHTIRARRIGAVGHDHA
jgi:hypothetical protein